jgi:hypothetical protein
VLGRDTRAPHPDTRVAVTSRTDDAATNGFGISLLPGFSQISDWLPSTNGRMQRAGGTAERTPGCRSSDTAASTNGARATKAWTDPPVNTRADNECETNADTCCLGQNFLVLNLTYRTADVYAYDTSIKPIENVPIVSGATVFDDLLTGNTYILVFHESLYYGEQLDHSLINPNQVCAYEFPSGIIPTMTHDHSPLTWTITYIFPFGPLVRNFFLPLVFPPSMNLTHVPTLI